MLKPAWLEVVTCDYDDDDDDDAFIFTHLRFLSLIIASKDKGRVFVLTLTLVSPFTCVLEYIQICIEPGLHIRLPVYYL